ncbi:MAG: tetratricopeptide repeat protein [Proteobacteria bacterium]|nr:tetratricopeptide repeat protein [Pseudomonadota bacterium]
MALPAAAQQLDVQRSLDEGFRRVFQNPADMGANRTYAKQLIDAGEYEKAVAALERILITDPTQTAVRVEIGALYFRLGSYEAARSYFQRALADPSLSPELRAEVERFLADIAERQSAHQFTGFAGVGARWQDNANSGPDATILRGGGFLVARPATSRPQSDFSFFGAGRVQHSYDLDTQNDAHIVSTLLGYGNAYSRFTRQDLVLGELTSGLRFKPAPADLKDLQIRPHFIGNYVVLDGNRYFSTLGFGLDATYVWSERLASELTFEYRRPEYGTNAALGDTQNQTGDEKVIKLRTAYELSASQTVIMDLLYRSTSTKRGYYDYGQYQATLTYNLVYAAPVQIAQPSWSVAPYVTWYSRPYAGPDPLVNPAAKRFDNQVRLGVVHTIPIAENWSTYQQVEHIWGDSNIPNYSFQDTAVVVGLTRRF